MTAIERIIIKERIRKEITKIPELAEDIKINGLLNPITVMEVDGGRYQLLAGLRRIKAVQSMGLSEIDVKVVLPADAEAVLRIEISENEQREPFTFSEKMDFARLIEDIEKAKANGRQTDGRSFGGTIAGKGRSKDVSIEVQGPQCYESNKERSAQTRDIVGSKIGMSGKQYDRAKYITKNAPDEVINQLDKGERSIRGTYDELRAKEKAAIQHVVDDSADTEDDLEEKSITAHMRQPPASNPKTASSAPKRACDVPEEETLKLFSKKDQEALRKLKEFCAMAPEEKVVELQRQLKEMTVRAIAAESDRDDFKLRYEISVDHKDSIIDSLKRQNADLREALTEADARIAELEKHHANQADPICG